MSDLISTPELIDWLRGKKYITVDETSDIMSEDFENKHQWELSRNCFINDAIKHIQEQPTIEAEPVRHGEWLPTRDSNKKECSNCGVIHLIAQYPHGQANYCPNCGAKMKGANDE